MRREVHVHPQRVLHVHRRVGGRLLEGRAGRLGEERVEEGLALEVRAHLVPVQADVAAPGLAQQRVLLVAFVLLPQLLVLRSSEAAVITFAMRCVTPFTFWKIVISPPRPFSVPCLSK